MALGKDPNVLGTPPLVPDLDAFAAEFHRALGVVQDNPDIAAQVGKSIAGNPINIQLVPEPATWAKDMLSGVQNSGDRWLQGMHSPSGSPVENAKKAAGKWKNNMQAAIAEDRWGKAMNKLTDEDIISVVDKVGSGAFTSGVANRADKIMRAITVLQPKVAALKRTIDAMPQDTDAQREARMVAARRGMLAIGKGT